MKRFHSIFPSLAVCLLVLLLVWNSEKRPASESGAGFQAASPARHLAGEAGALPSRHRLPPASRGVKELPADHSDVKLPKRADLRWMEPKSESVFEEFRRWTEELPAAGVGEGLQAGIRLAQQRRNELLRLIEKNPRRALELAVPHAVRQQLPEEIQSLLEERVDAQGDLLV